VDARSPRLVDAKVAILVTTGFEQSEFVEPRAALEAAGARTEVVSTQRGTVQGMLGLDRLDSFEVDEVVSEELAARYDALLVPGGLKSPDKLRTDPRAVAFARRFLIEDKPVAAICHGPALLIETGCLAGRTLTSYASLRTDLLNAGARWIDAEVHVDGRLITSRRPADIPAFDRALITVLAEALATTTAAR
jgi:protease I